MSPEPSPRPPRVSVILPVRNRARSVEAAARSVLDQTWTDLELIIVDGGSSDGTVAVLQGIAASDPRVRLLLHDRAEGVSAARNAGARLARGALLAFQDSDDSWQAGMLARQVDALESMPGARMSYAGVRRTLPDGVHLRPAAWDGSDGPVDGDLHPRLLGSSLITTPALVVEKALFDEVGGFDERLRYHEDWDLVVRLSARTPVACAKDWLVESTRGPDSLSADHGAYLDSLPRLAEAHRPYLQAYPRIHERRLADAGLLLVVNRRPGWPLVRQALRVRPWSLHGPFLRSGAAIVRSRLRTLSRRRAERRAGDAPAAGRQT